MGNIKKNSFKNYDNSSDSLCFFDDFSLCFKKKITKLEKDTLLNRINSKDYSVARDIKMKERIAFREAVKKKRQLINSNNITKNSNLQSSFEIFENDGIRHSNENNSVVSNLPIITTAPLAEITGISNFLSMKKNDSCKSKSKSILTIANNQANEIFFKRAADPDIEKLPNLIFNSINNKENLNTSFQTHMNKEQITDELTSFKLIKPEKLKETNTKGVNKIQIANLDHGLSYKNLALQELKFNAIISNISLKCNHPACKNFLQTYKCLKFSKENAFSFIRRSWFFDMEMYESKQTLKDGNIRQTCFLPKVYDTFLLNCKNLETVETSLKDSYNYSIDSQRCRWALLNTVIDSMQEVDFDLKYICSKDDSSLEECSIINNQLYSEQFNTDLVEENLKNVSEKENYYPEDLTFCSKRLHPELLVAKKYNKLTLRAKEFKKMNVKLKNNIPASSNKIFFEKDVSVTSLPNESSYSLSNNSDLPPWFKFNRKAAKQKKSVQRSPLKNINKNTPKN
ncbi:hypothetical protein QEN19_003403 [Hanseniaspora menglaensis]